MRRFSFGFMIHVNEYVLFFVLRYMYYSTIYNAHRWLNQKKKDKIPVVAEVGGEKKTREITKAIEPQHKDHVYELIKMR